MLWIGYLGVVTLVLSWVPQSIETIKLGRCPVNMTFLVLLTIGNVSLALYAISLGDHIFSVLNILTSVGSLINLYYKFFPRTTTK